MYLKKLLSGIGLVASIIGIYVFFSGNQSIQSSLSSIQKKSFKHYICGVSALHVRTHPGTYSRSLTSIPEKTEVVIISDVEYDGNNDPWIKVKGKGFTGWVNKTKVCTQ